MNPRTAAPAKQQSDTKASPFDLIAERETQEEQRLNEALEKLRAEETAAEKALLDTEKVEEDELRETAKKELMAQKEEIGKEMAKNEKTISKEVEKIDALYKERAPKVIEQQVEALLSLAA